VPPNFCRPLPHHSFVLEVSVSPTCTPHNHQTPRASYYDCFFPLVLNDVCSPSRPPYSQICALLGSCPHIPEEIPFCRPLLFPHGPPPPSDRIPMNVPVPWAFPPSTLLLSSAGFCDAVTTSWENSLILPISLSLSPDHPDHVRRC